MEKYEYLLLKSISESHFFTNEDLRMILDNFLNGGKTFTERTVTVE